MLTLLLSLTGYGNVDKVLDILIHFFAFTFAGTTFYTIQKIMFSWSSDAGGNKVVIGCSIIFLNS